MENGPKYAISKEGIIKLIVIAFGCVTFALLADVGYTNGTRMRWVFAAFIISFAISVLFYIFRITGLASKISTCGPCTFDGFDFLWSWFSTIWCLAAAVSFALAFPRVHPQSRWHSELIAAVIFAFLTGIAYAVEAYILKDKAPANVGYIATRNGWLKTVIVALGAAAFGLLVDSGYSWCGRNGPCNAGVTFALAAYIVGWGITVIIWLLHISGLVQGNRQSNLNKFEFIWSIVCVLLFWSASVCFAVYMVCRGNDFQKYRQCHLRLAGVIIGFVTGVLYIIDAVFLKRA
ncbi:myeloid-associated differentiation marker homolog [Styela clava]